MSVLYFAHRLRSHRPVGLLWLPILFCQSFFWTLVTHLASVWGPWPSSCSAGTGGQQQQQQQQSRGPCQPLLLASQTFLSVGCREKTQNKDSFCAAGPRRCVCIEWKHSCLAQCWGVAWYNCAAARRRSVDKLALWIFFFLPRTVQMTVTLLKPFSIASHVPVTRKHARLWTEGNHIFLIAMRTPPECAALDAASHQDVWLSKWSVDAFLLICVTSLAVILLLAGY